MVHMSYANTHQLVNIWVQLMTTDYNPGQLWEYGRYGRTRPSGKHQPHL